MPDTHAASLTILKRDTHMAALIKTHGAPNIMRKGKPFQALVRAIVYQQLSGKAAATILARFIALFPGKKFPTPLDVRQIPIEKMCAAGLSAQKASYLKDLAEKFLDGTVKHRSLHRMTSEEIATNLVQVKGIGEWSVHMFLIFTLGRPDVLPTGDLGVRKGFQIVYGLRALPTKREMEAIAAPWRKHASIAAWYLWRAADEKKR